MSSPTRRLFVGLAVSANLTEELQLIVRKMKISSDKKEIYFKWTAPANYHVTLNFLGDTDPGTIPEVEEKLKAITQQQSGPELDIKGIDGFDNLSSCRVLWAGVRRTQTLLNIQQQVEIALEPLGFRPENREYRPHLTLGKLKNAKSVASIAEPFSRKAFGSLHAKELTLYESRKENYMTTYHPLKSFPFRNEQDL